jgi:formylmethanofuran dehydrogenase subunit B
VLLVVGDRPFKAWPELAGLLFPDRDSRKHERRVVAVTSRSPETGAAKLAASLQAEASEQPRILAALRARANGRPLAPDFNRATEIEAAADILKAAKFGVALWSPEEIDTLAIEMLTGLVKDLNATTRWSGLSVSSDTSVVAAAMASGWMAGLPLRASFARGRPQHDPWQYDARRLVESGEADAVVWISAFGEPLPDWLGDVTTIALGGAAGAKSKRKAAVSISIGKPGRDHDGVVYDRETGTLVEIAARSPGELPSAAEVLNRIAALASPP